jgi:hypothetical protein
MERLTQSVKSGGVDGIGKITGIPFCLPAERAGLLRSGHVKEQPLRGLASEPSASGKKLVELECKKEHLGSLCRGLAHSHNKPEHCVENGLCKGGRRCTAFGFFAKFQDSLDAKFDGALGHVLLCIKRFGTKNWEEFEPPALQKEEQKAQVFDHLAAKCLLVLQLAAAAAAAAALLHSSQIADMADPISSHSTLAMTFRCSPKCASIAWDGGRSSKRNQAVAGVSCLPS